MLPNLSLLPASAKPTNGFVKAYPPEEGEDVDHDSVGSKLHLCFDPTPLHERALAKAQGPLEQAFLGGCSNQMVPRSQPTQLYGAVQRQVSQLSNFLVESHVKIEMYAGYRSLKSEPNPDEEMKQTLEPTFRKAQRNDQRTGIFVGVELSCFFSPGPELFTDPQKKAIVTAGLDRLYEKAALVTKPFRDDLGWVQLADVIQGDMNQARKAAEATVEPVLDDSLEPEVDVLAAVDQKEQAKYSRRLREPKAITDGAEIESRSQSFLSFTEGNYSIQSNTNDDTMAHAFPEEYQVYMSAMFKNLANDETRFSKVCLKGTTFELSFE